MDVVFGVGPIARALASALGRFGTVLQVGPQVVQGPFFWRRGDPATGEGVISALKQARRAFLVLEEDTPTRAFFDLLEPRAVARGVLVLPLDQEEPKGLRPHTDWSVVRFAPAWGPQDPLVSAWTRTLSRGGRVWVSDPGPIKPVAIADVVSAVRAAAGFRGLRWTVVGDEVVSLPELAREIAAQHDVSPKTVSVPLPWAARRAGVDPGRLLRWTTMPESAWHTPGWNPPEVIGRRGWARAVAP